MDSDPVKPARDAVRQQLRLVAQERERLEKEAKAMDVHLRSVRGQEASLRTALRALSMEDTASARLNRFVQTAADAVVQAESIRSGRPVYGETKFVASDATVAAPSSAPQEDSQTPRVPVYPNAADALVHLLSQVDRPMDMQEIVAEFARRRWINPEAERPASPVYEAARRLAADPHGPVQRVGRGQYQLRSGSVTGQHPIIRVEHRDRKEVANEGEAD